MKDHNGLITGISTSKGCLSIYDTPGAKRSIPKIVDGEWVCYGFTKLLKVKDVLEMAPGVYEMTLGPDKYRMEIRKPD